MILLLALGVLLAALLLSVTPAREGVEVFGVRLPEVCGMRRMGVSCPGCGLTRSFALGVRGKVEAFRLHPAGPILLLGILIQIPYRGLRLLRRRGGAAAEVTAPPPRTRLSFLSEWGLPAGIIGLVLAGWLLRLFVLC